jgi:phosphotransferase family enzyme
VNDQVLKSIPADRREHARVALTYAFDRAPLTGLQRISGGASGALIYRAEVAGRPYLLRLERQEGGGFHDPVRSFACMRIAAEAGIAPVMHFADATIGAAILEFVPQRPILDYPGGRERLTCALGSLLRRLQQTALFPPIAPYPDIVDFLLLRLRNSTLFAPGSLAAHIEGFARIREAYGWDPSSIVSSHNDPNRGNILFDGERLWLIDWETAFCNDPLVDVAILANYIASSPELEGVLLRTWLGRAPDRLMQARLTLMRQFVRLFYATVTLSMVPPTGGDRPETLAPTLAEFYAALATGRFVMGQPETMRAFGKAFLREFLLGLSAPGFEEALTVARSG